MVNPIHIVLVILEITCFLSTVQCFQASTRSVEIETEYNKAVSGQTFTCPFSVVTVCNATSYANFDGTCNNLVETLYGSTETPYKRILSAKYDAGSNKRTLASDGSSLPNPRDISNKLVDDNSFEPIWTHFFAAFGQFLTHDLTSAASSTSDADTTPECDCGSTDSACFPIEVTDQADVLGTSCMKFVRSSGSFKNLDCSDYGERENLNLISSFIDASNVYGNDMERSNSLRSFSGGLLLTSSGVDASYPYLPVDTDRVCSNDQTTYHCFSAGDKNRETENLALSGVHTIFMREHNRIATELAAINPSWDDEILFQQTRRIIVAILQHITYEQYVPSVIGSANTAAWGIDPTTDGSYFTGYDSSVNPGIYAEFATAAMRFGHTIVHNDYPRYSASLVEIDNTLDFHDINFVADKAYDSANGGIDSIVRGMLRNECGRYDMFCPSDLVNKLIDEPGGNIFDLAAYNINRGRDHGIPSYLDYVKLATGIDITSFSDLENVGWTRRSINTISSIYNDVADIELWIGGNAERNHGGEFDQLVGPTFTYIIGKQFSDLKKGDRFYYENAPSSEHGTESTAFTLDQLTEIKKVTMATLLCNNLDITGNVQPDPFFTSATSDIRQNLAQRCSNYEQMDFSKWQIIDRQVTTTRKNRPPRRT